MHKFQNNLAQVFFLKRRSSIWNIVNVCSLTATPSTPTAPSTPIHIFFQIWIDCHFVKTFTYPPHPQPHPRPKNILFFFFSNFDCRPPPPPSAHFFSDLKSLSICQNIHFIISPAPLHPPPPRQKKKQQKTNDLDSLPIQKKFIRPAPPRPAYNFFLRFGIFVKNNQLSPSCSLRGTYSKSEKNGGGGGGGGVGLGE